MGLSMEVVIGVHGSHNSSISLFIDGVFKEVLELERFISKKNAALYFYYPSDKPLYLLKSMLEYFKNKYSIMTFNRVYYNSLPIDKVKHLFAGSNLIGVGHHECHAFASLYQSNHTEALIFSFDGGSDQGFFNVYIASKSTGLQHVGKNDYDICVPYAISGHYCKEIRRESLSWGNLVYSGKLMGLAAFGKLDYNLISKLETFYRSCKTDDIQKADANFKQITGITVPIEGANLAACNQHVFEKLFREIFIKYKENFPNLPVHFVGGGALNILNNTEIFNEFGDIFVIPNSNDTSISIGAALSGIRPSSKVDVTYGGPDVFDKDMEAYYLNGRVIHSFEDMVSDLKNGKIIGMVNGTCENGPRALGNRSIFCLPHKGMKNILNKKVKGREYYRPFAPIVRLCDVSKYFEFSGESRWMTFAPKVKIKYSQQLAAVIHEDGTARVQTVTVEQNKFVYDILTNLEAHGILPILVNTSFNKAGKPILNTYKEAIEILNDTAMDGVCLNYKYIKK